MYQSIKILSAFLLFANFGFAQSKGCLMTETVVSKQDQPISKVTFLFDKHDNVLSRETIQYFDGVGVGSKILYEYNAKNKPIKTQYFFKNQLTRTVNSVYDTNGNLLSESESKENKINQRATKVENKLEQVFFNEDGSITAKHVSEKTLNMEVFTKYDAQNNITSNEKKILSTSGKVVENQFDDFLGKVKKTEKFKYNSDDRLVRSESYLADILDNYVVYDYVEGKLLKMTAFTKDDREDYRLEMKYTGNNQTEVISYYRNEMVNRKIKEYDTNNNCIKETNFNRDGQIINVATFKYTCK